MEHMAWKGRIKPGNDDHRVARVDCRKRLRNAPEPRDTAVFKAL